MSRTGALARTRAGRSGGAPGHATALEQKRTATERASVVGIAARRGRGRPAGQPGRGGRRGRAATQPISLASGPPSFTKVGEINLTNVGRF
jgi:hypothetical protein